MKVGVVFTVKLELDKDLILKILDREVRLEINLASYTWKNVLMAVGKLRI